MFDPLFTSVIAAVAAPSAPPDIHDIVAPQPYYVSGSLWLLLVAAVFLLAAVGVGWLLYVNLRKPKFVVVPTPREIAEGRLGELRDRLDATDARKFGGEVADILRVFIGAQYRLHAERQTSPEFLESIRGWPFFSVPQHTILQEFLIRCDLLKFARLDTTREGKLALIEQAAQFLAAEPPSLPAGTPAVTPASGRLPGVPPLLMPPPLPGAMEGFELPDARYMPPGQRQTALLPTEPVVAATEP